MPSAGPPLGAPPPRPGGAGGAGGGGGFEWMLNCDLVAAADDLVAFFPEMDWAQFVTGGVTHLLPLGVGYQRAMELFVLGERQSAVRLLELGLVNWVAPHGRGVPPRRGRAACAALRDAKARLTLSGPNARTAAVSRAHANAAR